MTLSTQDYAAILNILDRLSGTDTIENFVTTFLQALPGLVGADSIGYEEIRPAEGSALRVSDPIEAARPDLWEAFAAHFHEHPMVARFQQDGDDSVHRLSDFMTDRELRQTGLHSEVLGPAGVAHQTGFSLASNQAPFIAITLARGFGSDFSDRDLEVLEALRRPVRRLREAAESQMVLRTLDASGNAAVVVIGLDERAVWVSPQARALAEEHDLAFEPGQRVAPPCTNVIETGAPTTVAVEGSRLRIRRLGPDDDRRLRALLLERIPGPPSRHSLDRLGLSPRETDVLLGLVEGHSNAEIAADLVISIRTVRKHLEAVYDKLGVHSRSEAVAVAYQMVMP